MTKSGSRTDVDFEGDGKRVGWLQLPCSVHRSACGNISIPVAVIKGGQEKAALLTAGNHGDEHEGRRAVTPTSWTAREPVTARLKTNGMVICKRYPGRVERGGRIAHLASNWLGLV